MKENSNFKIIKVMKPMSKNWINHLLLSNAFNDKYWISQLDLLHLSIQHNNKCHYENKPNSNNTFLLLLGLWPKKLMVSIYQSILGSTLPCLQPLIWALGKKKKTRKVAMVSIWIFSYYLVPIACLLS